MHHDPNDLRLICLLEKCKIRFRIENSNLDFPKELYPKLNDYENTARILLWRCIK